MSIEAINVVRGRRFGSAMLKSVMYVLADYCDAEWSCFVGQQRLSAEAEVSERTVRKMLADMEASGMLRREKRYGGLHGRTSDRITLSREVIESLPATAAASVDQPASEDDLPANGASLPADDDGSTGKAGAGEPLETLQVDQKGEPARASAQMGDALLARIQENRLIVLDPNAYPPSKKAALKALASMGVDIEEVSRPVTTRDKKRAHRKGRDPAAVPASEAA